MAETVLFHTGVVNFNKNLECNFDGKECKCLIFRENDTICAIRIKKLSRWEKKHKLINFFSVKEYIDLDIEYYIYHKELYKVTLDMIKNYTGILDEKNSIKVISIIKELI